MKYIGYKPLIYCRWKEKEKDRMHRLATKAYIKNKYV